MATSRKLLPSVPENCWCWHACCCTQKLSDSEKKVAPSLLSYQSFHHGDDQSVAFAIDRAAGISLVMAAGINTGLLIICLKAQNSLKGIGIWHFHTMFLCQGYRLGSFLKGGTSSVNTSISLLLAWMTSLGASAVTTLTSVRINVNLH